MTARQPMVLRIRAAIGHRRRWLHDDHQGPQRARRRGRSADIGDGIAIEAARETQRRRTRDRKNGATKSSASRRGVGANAATGPVGVSMVRSMSGRAAKASRTSRPAAPSRLPASTSHGTDAEATGPAAPLSADHRPTTVTTTALTSMSHANSSSYRAKPNEPPPRMGRPYPLQGSLQPAAPSVWCS